MKKTTLLLIALFSASLAFAQQPDPFGDALRRMDSQMRRGLPPADSSSGNTFYFSFPQQTDSTYFFRFDTTFSNGSGSFFFQFSPMPGQGSEQFSPMTDPFGLQQMMQQFFNFGMGFDDPFMLQGMPPADDGNRQSEDGLLPEERLRQSAPPPATPGKGAQPKPKSKSEEIKTTRI
ncbi:MAG: hypothetical protein U0U46_03650 [Saprospiraceae bacterium]